MLHHIAPKSASPAEALALPLNDDESGPKGNQTTTGPTSLYTLALLVRIGLVAAILLRAFTLWQW